MASRFEAVPDLFGANRDVLWPVLSYVLTENLGLVGIFYLAPYIVITRWYGWTPLVRGRLLYVTAAAACYQ